MCTVANGAPLEDGVEETEPDYRFTLANERTFLAWQRTALGLLAAAVALVNFVPELVVVGARRIMGIGLAALASRRAGPACSAGAFPNGRCVAGSRCPGTRRPGCWRSGSSFSG